MTKKIYLIIIGDEILSGKRKDRHLENAIMLLKQHNLMLTQSMIIGDEPAVIIQCIRQHIAPKKIVFCFGGIGATPDDYTRQCAADAFSVPMIRHSTAVKMIEDQFADAAYPKRVLMADLPQGAELIPNPVNNVPGFSVNQFHFLPGFPEMSQPMMKWVLENHYQSLEPLLPDVEKCLWVHSVSESELIDLMQDILVEFPEIKLSSLPKRDERGGKIEIGIKGKKECVKSAFNRLYSGLCQMKLSVDLI